MKRKKFIRYVMVTLIAIGVVGGGLLAYFIANQNILAAISALTLLYTLSKPIQNDLDDWIEKDKVLRFHSIYSDKEADFSEDINKGIDALIKEGCSIVEVNVLSTKRAVIQYRKVIKKDKKKNK